MIGVLLASHITIAFGSLAYAGGVIQASAKQHMSAAARRAKVMWYGTIGTIVSGVALAVLAKSPVTGTCVTLFSFLIVVLIAHAYNRLAVKRLAIEHSDS